MKTVTFLSHVYECFHRKLMYKTPLAVVTNDNVHHKVVGVTIENIPELAVVLHVKPATEVGSVDDFLTEFSKKVINIINEERTTAAYVGNFPVAVSFGDHRVYIDPDATDSIEAVRVDEDNGLVKVSLYVSREKLEAVND